MPLHWAFRKPGHFNPVQHPAGLEIADLEAQQIIDVHEAQRLRAVDRKRADNVREGPHFFHDRVSRRIGDGQHS